MQSLKELNALPEQVKLNLIIQGVDFAMYIASKDQADYQAFKEGKLINARASKLIEMEVLKLLETLGYDMEAIGTYFYKEVVARVAMSLHKEKISSRDMVEYKDLIKELKDPYSQFYFNIAREDLDIGLKTFHACIAEAIDKINYDVADPILLNYIYSRFNSDIDYGEQAFALGAFVAGKLEPIRDVVPKVRKLIEPGLEQTSCIKNIY